MTDELKKRMARLRELAPGSTAPRTRLPGWWPWWKSSWWRSSTLESRPSRPSSIRGLRQDENGNTRMVRQTLAFGRVGTATEFTLSTS